MLWPAWCKNFFHLGAFSKMKAPVFCSNKWGTLTILVARMENSAAVTYYKRTTLPFYRDGLIENSYDKVECHMSWRMFFYLYRSAKRYRDDWISFSYRLAISIGRNYKTAELYQREIRLAINAKSTPRRFTRKKITYHNWFAPLDSYWSRWWIQLIAVSGLPTNQV